MATSRKQLRAEMRDKIMDIAIKHFADDGEEVLRVKSNEFAFPITDSEGNEDFVVINIKIPTGAEKGTEPYDGYACAQEYEMKIKSKAEAAIEKEKKKAEKIAKDELRRANEAKIKLNHELVLS
jgi:hypothetical protein